MEKPSSSDSDVAITKDIGSGECNLADALGCCWWGAATVHLRGVSALSNLPRVGNWSADGLAPRLGLLWDCGSGGWDAIRH